MGTVDDFGLALELQKHGPQDRTRKGGMQVHDIGLTAVHEFFQASRESKCIDHSAGAVVEGEDLDSGNGAHELALALRQYRRDAPGTEKIPLHLDQVADIRG